jgi:hypothetical protein
MDGVFFNCLLVLLLLTRWEMDRQTASMGIFYSSSVSTLFSPNLSIATWEAIWLASFLL